MKQLEEFILEKLKISKVETKYRPKSKGELIDIINKEIEANGMNCSLNHIDVSNITDMSFLFMRDKAAYYSGSLISDFDGDISTWQINPKAKGNMNSMFVQSPLENNPPAWYK